MLAYELGVGHVVERQNVYVVVPGGSPILPLYEHMSGRRIVLRELDGSNATNLEELSCMQLHYDDSTQAQRYGRLNNGLCDGRRISLYVSSLHRLDIDQKSSTSRVDVIFSRKRHIPPCLWWRHRSSDD